MYISFKLNVFDDIVVIIRSNQKKLITIHRILKPPFEMAIKTFAESLLGPEWDSELIICYSPQSNISKEWIKYYPNTKFTPYDFTHSIKWYMITTQNVLILCSARRFPRIGRTSPMRHIPLDLIRMIGDFLL